jgi:GABA(A) receptor-associated protein
MRFQSTFSFEDRCKESSRIREKFPQRIPIIVERATNSKTVPDLDKSRFLVPGEITVAQFIYVIRRRMTLPPETALYVFVNDTLPLATADIREIYSQHANRDGFLYMKYTGENTFG